MEKIARWINKNIWYIILISTTLMVVGCCIVGYWELNPLWYILCFFLGLGVLIPFVYVIVRCLIVLPIEKLIKKRKQC